MMYEKCIPPCLEFIIDGVDGTDLGDPLKMTIPQTNLNMLVQFCNAYDAMFVPLQSGEQYDEDTIQCGFVEVKKKFANNNNYFCY